MSRCHFMLMPYAHPNFVSSGHACARLCNAAWECPPSRGRATDARSVELLGHVRPRLTYPIRVVFHIDTTRGEAEALGCGGLWASDGLGRTGWTRAFRVEFQARLNGSGRLGRIASAGLGWADSTGLNLHKPKRWAEPVREAVIGEDEVGRRRGVRRPRAAVPASERRGDGAGRHGRRRRVLPGLRRTWERRYEAWVGRDRKGFRVFGEGFEFSGEGFSEFNCRKSEKLREGNGGVLFKVRS
ncbi:hypothetical protein CDL15_Pgr006072 [Punica granatum]|uniref:Uncharacterized protein n=1 Tax=Punica granatum TaxID=22663 RepID=A0A218VUQ8_PUNGR|nr:hypothetical protein CDL15_Pgr006072 [Punica granatum]